MKPKDGNTVKLQEGARTGNHKVFGRSFCISVRLFFLPLPILWWNMAVNYSSERVIDGYSSYQF